jgi:lipopolysaccharide O-acetyltransferase
MTKIFYRPARLIRHPVRIRGANNIMLNKGFTSGYYCRLEAFSEGGTGPTLIMGENLNIGDSCHITSLERVQFGANVLIGSSVFISDHDHGYATYGDMRLSPVNRKLISSPVIIEDNVWIGEKVIILKGVKIGANSIIGAGAVVTSDVPPYSVVVGVPGKVLKTVEKQ